MKKVLIVDDMELNREILTEILGEDYSVLEAENGRQALEMIEQNLNDLAVILLDLVMPEMDGLEVLAILQEKGWMKKVPVLIISGEQSLKIEKQCFDFGISDFTRNCSYIKILWKKKWRSRRKP